MTDPVPDIRCVNSPHIAPPAGHYSHACIAGGHVFISGQLPVTAQGVPRADASFSEQAELTLANLEACLAIAGVGREDLTQVRIYITDIAQWPIFNAIYTRWLGDHRPARAVAGVSELHYGAAVEIEAVALARHASR